MINFLKYYNERIYFRDDKEVKQDIEKEYYSEKDIKESLLLLTDKIIEIKTLNSYKEQEGYSNYFDEAAKCAEKVDILLENYDKLKELDTEKNQEIFLKIKNGIINMANEIESIKNQMLFKKLNSIKAEVEVIVAKI